MSAFDPGTLPPAGPPRFEPLGRVPGDLDLHAVALSLGAPALVERGDAPRESWHVVPLAPAGTLSATRDGVTWRWAGSESQQRGARGLDALRALLEATESAAPARDVPFAGGLAVLLGYGLAHEIERLPETTEERDAIPRLFAVACPASLLVPVGGGEALFAWLPGGEPRGGGPRWGLGEAEAAAWASRVRGALASPVAAPVSGGPAGDVVPLWTRADHEAAVRAVIENLFAGEIYQANLTQRFECAWEGSALPLHAVLRRSNPSPFSGWIREASGAWEVVSGSPERLVLRRGRELMTEPIKGTRVLPAGPATPPETVAALRAELLASEKDQAELVMIVDLHRNDLGRVSAPGTVRVEEMRRVDRRSHVLQAIADIRGVLAEGRDAVDVVEGMFPGGSVTGVPKIRAMEILDSLERWSRGPYTGSFGLVASWGDMDLNILIRSAWRSGGRLAFAAGGGIVVDSDPGSEYLESLGKAEAVRLAIEALRR